MIRSFAVGVRGAAVTLATLLGWVVALAAPRDFTVGTFQDDAQYAVLAKAIREQHTYRNLNFPGHPPELKFAPGWPAGLGHASIVMTADVYSHLLPTMQRAAADRLEAMFG